MLFKYKHHSIYSNLETSGRKFGSCVNRIIHMGREIILNQHFTSETIYLKTFGYKNIVSRKKEKSV